MFNHEAFVRAGVTADRRECAEFYKAFHALARDADLREACNDDRVVALGALSLTRDLLKGGMVPLDLSGQSFRELAARRGQQVIAERVEMEGAAEAHKRLPKPKPCDVILSTEPDTELAALLQAGSFKRISGPNDRPIIYRGLGCAKTLRVHLHSEDRVIFQNVVLGTRSDVDSRGIQKETAAEPEVSPLPSGVKPYVVATVDPPEGTTFQDASGEELRDLIVRIANIEAPLNRSILEKRLRAGFAVGSIRSVHEKRIDTAVQAAIDGGHMARTDDGFLLSTAMERVCPRFRAGHDEDVRATANISIIEIHAAIRLQMKSDPGRDHPTIVLATAKLLGFAIRSEHINRLLSDKVGAEVTAILLAEDGTHAPERTYGIDEFAPEASDA